MKPPSKTSKALTDALRDELPPGHDVYALVDGAHDPHLLPQIISSGHRFACLFDEREAAHLAHSAVFLVHVPADHDLIGILGHGLGRAWFSFVRSALDFDAVLHHLQQYSKCRHDEGNGRAVDAYFAFWDPRVAADWLPTLQGVTAQHFFAPFEAFCAESPAREDRLMLYRYVDAAVTVTEMAMLAECEACT